MCLRKIIKYTTLKSDLKVKKVVWKRDDGSYYSGIGMGVEQKLLIDKKCKAEVKGLLPCFDTRETYLCGFHCYDNRTSNQTIRKIWNISTSSYTMTIIYCTIPKGTTIIIGIDGSSHINTVQAIVTPVIINKGEQK